MSRSTRSMRKALLFSPRFPPANAPDHQRVRMMIGRTEAFGWETEVLAVDPQFIEGEVDPHTEASMLRAPAVHWSSALSQRWTRPLGFGGLGYRAAGRLRTAGDQLLRGGGFDLVFASTTEFPCMPCARSWFKRFGVPYVVDMQDPWVNDYYALHPEVTPPGGRVKHWLSQGIAKLQERKVIADAAAIVCVTPGYPEMFERRYGPMDRDRFAVVPFAVAASDFDFVIRQGVEQNEFSKTDGLQHWVYVGAASGSMHETIRGLFQGLNSYWKDNADSRRRTRIHFVGTSYALRVDGSGPVKKLARECGVEDVVTERTGRVSYFEAIRCLLDADAILIPGTSEPAQSPSKIYPCLFAQKPTLGLFDERSPVAAQFPAIDRDWISEFPAGAPASKIAELVLERLRNGWPDSRPACRRESLHKFSAEAMTEKICSVFDRALERSRKI